MRFGFGTCLAICLAVAIGVCGRRGGGREIWVRWQTLDIFHEVDGGARIDTSMAATDALGKDGQVLAGLAEEDEDTGSLVEVLGDEDGDVWFVCFRAEGKADGFHAMELEPVDDDPADGI